MIIEIPYLLMQLMIIGFAFMAWHGFKQAFLLQEDINDFIWGWIKLVLGTALVIELIVDIPK